MTDDYFPPAPNGKGEQHLTVLPKPDFICGFRPPSYLIDGILQRRFIYSLTGQTGHAKTAIALLLAELVASLDPNAMLLTHRVKSGRVVYFVGENPDDVRMRVIGADAERGGNPLTDRIWFIAGVFNLEKMFEELELQILEIGPVDLIIVDTSAAYFLGNEELSNTQMGSHARMLRRLTTLPGGPCVLVLCHPIKHAADPSQLLPRGGGAFLAEVDGNLTAWKSDNVIVLDHTAKFRGPGFEPIEFELKRIETHKLVDDEGNLLPTIRAVPIPEQTAETKKQSSRTDEDALLAAMLVQPGRSIGDLARACHWLTAKGEPYKSKVQRVLGKLQKLKPALVVNNRDNWELTEKGKIAARDYALHHREEHQIGEQIDFLTH
jgi:AAA domain